MDTNKTIIQRQGENCTISDTIHIKLPEDRSILSIIGNNEIIADGHYAPDFYVYVDGVRVKKWFEKIEDVRVWPPAINDLASIEKRYVRIKEYVDAYINEIYNKAFNAVIAVKKAHANPIYNSTKKAWWVYNICQYSSSNLNVIFDWLDEEPNPIMNYEIGQAFYLAQHRMMQLLQRQGRFKRVLFSALTKYVNSKYSHIKPETDTVICLNINGRNYFFRLAFNGYNYSWTLFHFADNPMIEERL